MPLASTTTTSKSRPGVHEVALGVTQTAADELTVAAGEFKCSETDYELLSPAVFALTPQSDDQIITAYLAIEVSSGNVVVLVDEHIQDGVDMAYQGGPDYTLLCRIFVLHVPASATDLSSSTLSIRHHAAES